MSEIALYDALTKLGLDPKEAKEAVVDVASSKDIATKADLANLESRVIEKMANLETRLARQTYAAVGIILAGVGLMIKFL